MSFTKENCEDYCKDFDLLCKHFNKEVVPDYVREYADEHKIEHLWLGVSNLGCHAVIVNGDQPRNIYFWLAVRGDYVVYMAEVVLCEFFSIGGIWSGCWTRQEFAKGLKDHRLMVKGCGKVENWYGFITHTSQVNLDGWSGEARSNVTKAGNGYNATHRVDFKPYEHLFMDSFKYRWDQFVSRHQNAEV